MFSILHLFPLILHLPAATGRLQWKTKGATLVWRFISLLVSMGYQMFRWYGRSLFPAAMTCHEFSRLTRFIDWTQGKLIYSFL